MYKSTVQNTRTGTESWGQLSDNVAIMRLDHSIRHILIIPGMTISYLLGAVQTDLPARSIVLGLSNVIYIAFANYTINKWLNRDFDKYRPPKSQRSAVQEELRGSSFSLGWRGSVTAGLLCAWRAYKKTFAIAEALAPFIATSLGIGVAFLINFAIRSRIVFAPSALLPTGIRGLKPAFAAETESNGRPPRG